MPVDPGLGERLARRVSSLYEVAEVSLLRRVSTALAEGVDSPTWALGKFAKLDALRRAMRVDVDSLTREADGAVWSVLLESWGLGRTSAVRDLEELSRPTPPRVPPSTSAALTLLANETLGAVRPVGPALLRGAVDLYQAVAAQAASTVLLGGDTRLGAAQTALDSLTRRGVRTFVDTSGRRWEGASYVEMAVRTGAGKAAVEGHVDQLRTAGIDLVMVSDHPRECELCRPWEGKVLSLSGPTGRLELPSSVGDGTVSVTVAATLDRARASGLQHPNCRHAVSAYLPGASRPATRTESTDAAYAEGQKQRYLERGVREWKRREAVAITPEAQRYTRAKVREWQTRLRTHVETTEGLSRASAREQIGTRRRPRAR